MPYRIDRIMAIADRYGIPVIEDANQINHPQAANGQQPTAKEEAIFKIGMCLPAGPYVTDEDVRYIVDCIKEAIEK